MAKPIIVDNFHQGIKQSPYLGFADLRNVDVSSVYGLLRPNYAPSKVSASLIDGEVNNIVFDPATAANAWAVANGKIFKSTDGGTSWALITGNTTSGSAWNIVIWKDYLLYFLLSSSNIVVETYGPLSGSPSWDTSFETYASEASGAVVIPAIHAQDDKVYFASGRYIHSLKEVVGQDFAPGTSATYVKGEKVLDLPEGYKVQTLTELGTQLMIGTSRGLSFSHLSADIFPWDRVSPSFSLPIRIPDFGVRSAITIGRTMYFFVGGRGRLMATNGSDVQEVARLPIKLIGFAASPDTTIAIKQYGMTQKGDKIVFGVGAGNNNSGIYGVWSYNLITGALVFEHKISTGTMTGASVAVTALQYRGGGNLLIGWVDAGTYGIDQTSTSTVYGSYGAFAVSKVFYVGSFDRPAEYSKLRVTLGKDLIAGDGVRVSWRLTDSASYSTPITFDYTTYGSARAATELHYFEVPIKITARLLQIKIEITTSGTSIPEVLECRIY